MAPTLTHKQKLFGALVLFLVSLALGSIVYVMRSHSDVQGGKVVEATISFLYGLLSALLIALVAFAFKPFQTWLQVYLATPDVGSTEIRLLLFGLTGSGKSTFAKHVLTLTPLSPTEATKGFAVQEDNAALEFAGSEPTKFRVLIGDYRGEEPSQVTVQIPSSFAGVEGSRAIDAVIFFVDLIGREHDKNNPDQVLDDEKLLEWLRQAPREQIESRINQHNLYLSSSTLEILFSVVYGTRLRTVYFVITKADLMRKAAEEGILPGFPEKVLRSKVESAFSDVVERIDAACKRNEMDPCIVHMISLRDESARNFMFEAIRRIYQARGGGR